MGSKTLFPESWNFKDINDAAVFISKNVSNTGEITKYGWYHRKGLNIKIVVQLKDGKIVSCYPTWLQE